MDTCAYEQLRMQNVEENKRFLAELGLTDPYKPVPKVIKKGVRRQRDDEGTPEWRKSAKKPRMETAEDLENSGSIRGSGSRRLSARIRGQTPGTECVEEDDKVEGEDGGSPNYRRPVMPDRPNWYGEVPGVDVGTIWLMRMDCCHDGVHRPPVAGIHGGPEGAYSIALSGGYEDDVDLGDCFTFTGEGGRDLRGTKNNPKNLRTAPQSKDQDLTRGNLALSRSVETGNPVRVIRGYKLKSPFAPDEGYRYDGLYTVEKYWFSKGVSGFGVYKFLLRRSKDQAPPPWDFVKVPSSPSSKSSDSGFPDAAMGDSEALSNTSGSRPESPENVEESKSSEASNTSDSGRPESPENVEESKSSEEKSSEADNEASNTSDSGHPESPEDVEESKSSEEKSSEEKSSEASSEASNTSDTGRPKSSENVEESKSTSKTCVSGRPESPENVEETKSSEAE